MRISPVLPFGTICIWPCMRECWLGCCCIYPAEGTFICIWAPAMILALRDWPLLSIFEAELW